jgi:hypothetical protein
MGYRYDVEKMPSNEVLVEDDEGWGMVCGPDFGCILAELKQTNNLGVKMKTRDIALLAAGAASVQPRTEYVTKIVHEHRAPTDESIRLAREYEEKAWAEVEKRMLWQIPGIQAQVIVAESDHGMREKHVIFSINGRRMHICHPESVIVDTQQIIKDIANKVAEEITIQLLRFQK